MSEDACWSTIGVWGSEKPRCHLLDQVVHCRNCEVFVKAGRKLLDREVTGEEREEAAARFAAELEQQDIETESVMVFAIGEELLALSSSAMLAVVSARGVHTLPHRSNMTFRGLVTIRGRLKLCVALDQVLGIPRSEESSETRMLVVSHNDEEFVFPVDRVIGLQRHDVMRIAVAGTQASAVHSSCLRGVLEVDSRPVSLLDTEKLWSALRREIGL